jgi:acylphosphatase
MYTLDTIAGLSYKRFTRKKCLSLDVEIRVRNLDDDAHAAAKAAAALERKSLNRYILDAIDVRNATHKGMIAAAKNQRLKNKTMK